MIRLSNLDTTRISFLHIIQDPQILQNKLGTEEHFGHFY